ncbi:TetR/AcrR family transcriptional regulator [Sutterella sp.]|uniref:TetR/AcrR family transcriptional regulator n=1 Tax=Sutterella sp. TaxID=1981025 RepID=UPI0026E0B7DA|nr:TetR/AcrR family transcriptional regulator [Sutterella sp.]MDO5532114.1 TetR/AcrR family transcriptional regulator [Sutterella sp.]
MSETTEAMTEAAEVSEATTETTAVAPKPVKLRRRRLSGEDRRNEILDAALEASKKSGRVDVPVLEVARAAGVSRNLIYHYFGSPAVLFKALIRRELARVNDLVAAVPEGSTPDETVRALIGTYIGLLEGYTLTLRNLATIENPKHPLARAVRSTQALLAERLVRARGCECTGAVRDAALGFLGFVVRFVREAGGRNVARDPEALDLCVRVFDDALARARSASPASSALRRADTPAPAGRNTRAGS